MNIEKKTLEKVDVLYDDKKWGKRIDPDEWNANFKALENAHNKLVDSLTEQVNIVDEAFSNATNEGGNNIHVDYSGGDFTLQQALDHVVNDINNRYTKLQSDTLLAENTNVLIRDISYNSQTGTFTITKKDGSVITIDTVIEKIPASMVLKEESDGSVWLVVTNQDGSQTKTNVTSLIEDTVIKGGDVINVSSSTDSVKKVTTYTLNIKPNSIGLTHVDSELTAKFEETQNAKTLAVQAKDLAVNAKNNAETYASNANTYSVNSNKSATESANSALEAKRYAEQAASYKNSAESAKTSAIQAKNYSETAKTDAQAAATDASKSKIAAEQSASSASESASSASESATNASNSAASALQFKEAAALFEANSLANKNSSAKSASAAATSETNAASSALAAQTAQTAAEKARDEAQAIAGSDYATKVELNTHANNTALHFTADEKTKLAGIEENANNYTHPLSHPANMITEDSTHRFVSDTEKNVWDSKSDFSGEYKDLTNKPTVSASTLLASSWDSMAKTYSFESTYPNASYDIEIALDSTATAEQAEAFNGAQIVGSATSNIIKAYSDVPTVNIPVIIKVVRK